MTRFEHTTQGPTFSLTVPSQEGEACKLSVTWSLTQTDASCWDRPLSIEISPDGGGEWETVVDLTREDVRLLRSYLDLMLSCPDLRQHADGTWLRKPEC